MNPEEEAENALIDVIKCTDSEGRRIRLPTDIRGMQEQIIEMATWLKPGHVFEPGKSRANTLLNLEKLCRALRLVEEVSCASLP